MNATDGLIGYAPPLARNAALDRSSRVPLWRQVELDLERRVRRGEFGSVFPGELELTAQYEVSRQTVRQALRALRESGVVLAARGKSSSLARAAIKGAGAAGALFEAAASETEDRECHVREIGISADGTIAARLGLEESTPLVLIDRVHYLQGEPMAWDRAWLPAEIAKPLLTADFTTTPLESELDRCGISISGGRELMRAVVPPDPVRRILQTGYDEAAIELSCTGESSGQPIMWRQILVRGTRFALYTSCAGTDATEVSVTVADQSTREPYAWRGGSTLIHSR